MATKLLRSAYQDLHNLLSSLHWKWRTVVDKVATGYELAYGQYKRSGPTYVPMSSDVPEYLELGMDAGLHWLGHGRRALVLVPVARAINVGVHYLYSQAPSARITAPTVDLAPAKFRGTLTHFVDITFTNFEDFVGTLVRYADDRAEIPDRAAHEMWDQMALSPLYYPPADWQKWDAEEIAHEFERRLWARWAKKMAYSLPGTRLGNYNYAKIVERLADLTIRESDTWRRLESTYSEEAGAKVNIGIAVQLVKWAKHYVPLKRIDYPLPIKVQDEMAQLAVLSAFDELILGVPLGKRFLGGSEVPLPQLTVDLND